jgi:hypothetical protein
MFGSNAPSSSPEDATPSKLAYQYRPLGEDETRLLLLYPGEADEPVRCSLEGLASIQATDAPYTAVSYSWTEVSGVASIECDGAEFQITQSAYNVLRRLRDTKKTRRLWIDGLCINQQDSAEKETVVKRMLDIYSSAAEVVIWLGETEPQDEGFFNDYTRWTETKELGTPYDFFGLLRRAWFTRKWILQEAILAKPDALTVACGGRTIPWDGSDGFASFVLNQKMGLHVGKVPDSDRIQQAIRTVRFIDEKRTNKRPASSLFHVLLRTRYTDASNVTDYVAAVLGLAQDWNMHCGLSPAYGHPGEENSDSVKNQEFINLATWDIRQNRSIRVLAYASGPKKESVGKESAGLPSWVPDWTIKDGPEPLSTYSPMHRYRGSKEKVGNVHLCNDGHPLLEVEGAVIDVIRQVTAQAPGEFSRSRLRIKYADDPAARSAVRQWFEQCLQLASNGDNKGDLQLSSDDFSRLAYAMSFRFHTAGSLSSTVWHFRHSTELVETLAEYLYEITGQCFYDRPRDRLGPFFGWTAEEMIGQVEEPLRRWAIGRRFCRTGSGRIGFVPGSARAGDKICMVQGHGAPYVLREHGDKYMAVGECFFDGLMDMTPEDIRGLNKQQKFMLI